MNTLIRFFLILAFCHIWTTSYAQTVWNETRPAGDADKWWLTASMSSDGSKIIAGAGGGRLYLSADGGTSWSETQPAGAVDKVWRTSSMSSDGSKIIAGVEGGRLYLSADGGTSWSETQPAGDVDKWLYTSSMSSDGIKIIAGGVNGGRLYLSADGGTSWSETQPAGAANKDWLATSMSSDGIKIIAGVIGGRLYLSEDGGTSWSETQPAGDFDQVWQSTSMSSDGSKIIAGPNSNLYISDDGGDNWMVTHPALVNWRTSSMSSDGIKIIAGVDGGRLYLSEDGGTSWSETQPAGDVGKSWHTSSMSSDGSKIIAGVNGGRLYIGYDLTANLIYPVNGSTGQPVRVRFEWEFVSGADGYDIEVSDDPTFGALNIIASKTVSSGSRTYWDIDVDLTNGTRYYWRVRSFDGAVNSNWSDVWDFVVTSSGISGISYPVPNYPVGGITIMVADPILAWYMSGTWVGITKYEIEYKAADANFEGGIVNTAESIGGSNLIKQISGLQAATDYYWRVRAYNGTLNLYSSWSVVGEFTTDASISGAPTKPFPLYPKDNVTVYHTDKPLLHWYVTAFNLDLTFNVEVDRVDAGPAYVNVFSGSTTTSDFWIQVGASLEPGKQYRWRVQTVKAPFPNSAWSDYAIFTMDITTLGAPVKPTILYPKNDAIVYTGTPTLHWYVTYQIPGVEWNIRVTGPGYDETETSNSYQYYFEWPDELTAGESYTWQVQSKKGLATSNWSDPEDFVVYEYANGVPVKPTPIWPVGNATIYQNPPMLHWYVSTYVPGVEYEVEVVLTGDAFTGTGELTNSYQQYFQWPNILVGGQTYKWRARSMVGAAQSTWSDEGIFTISATHAIGSLPRPVLVYPDGITVYVTKPILSWYVSTLTNVELFRVKVATNGAMTHHIAGSPFTTTTMSYAFENDLVPGTTYYWTVESSDGAGSYSTISNVGEFTINPESGAVVPKIGGPDGIFLSSTTANLNWYLPAPSTSELKYELEYSTSKDFSNSTKIDNVTGLKYTLENLQAGTEYYWRVRSAAGSEMSAYSFRGTFVPKNVTDVEEEAEVPEKFEVSQNYPNPFNPVTTISYSIPEASYVTIKIYNMLGQEVKTLLSLEVETGVYKIQWNGDNNSGQKVVSGTYIYRVKAGENAQARKMILLK